MKQISVSVDELEGKTFTTVRANEDRTALYFKVSEEERYVMQHVQDCCEDVSIEDITGELSWLENTPILRATEDTNKSEPRDAGDDSWLWTFYNIATVKGNVTIRWYGSSNGYYSEDVDLFKEISS